MCRHRIGSLNLALAGSRPAHALALVLCLFASATAQAQTPAADAGMPAGFAGVGLGVTTNDAASRMRLYEEGIARQWQVDMAVALSERISLGAEYSKPSTAITSTLTKSGTFAGRQEERVLIGLLRVRLAGLNRWAVDAVGGGGVLFQTHKSGRCAPSPAPCEDTSGPSATNRAPVWALGFDVPVRIAAHVELVPSVRGYWLLRGEHTSATIPNLDWPFEWRSSTRLAAVVSGRVVW